MDGTANAGRKGIAYLRDLYEPIAPAADPAIPAGHEAEPTPALTTREK